MTSISCPFARQINRTFQREVTVYRTGDVTRASGVAKDCFVTITDTYLMGKRSGSSFAKVAWGGDFAEYAESSRWTTSALDDLDDASPARIQWVSEYNGAFAESFPGECRMAKFSARKIAKYESPMLRAWHRGEFVIFGDVVCAPTQWPTEDIELPRAPFEIITAGNMRGDSHVTALVKDSHFVVRSSHCVAIWKR